jgi:hypothetical protein
MADIAMKGWQDGKWEVPKWEFDGKPALLIMHMQQGIVGAGTFSGAPHEQEAESIKEGKILENQKKLLKAFRQRNADHLRQCRTKSIRLPAQMGLHL